MATEPTSNEKFHDAMLRHQIYLLRYSGYLSNKVVEVLTQSEPAIAEKILGVLRDSPSLKSAADLKRFERLVKGIETIRGESWKGANDILQTQLKDLAISEITTVTNILSTVSPTILNLTKITSPQLQYIVKSQPFQGRVLKEWVQTMASEDLRRMSSAIRYGMVAGQTTPQIVNSVVGTQSLKKTDGVVEITRKQVDAVVRTAVQNVANGARSELYKANADVFTSERFLATLDARTTPICRAMDGKIFPVGEGPQPPLHFRCRSTRIPEIDPGGSERGFVAGTEKQMLREFAAQKGIPPPASRAKLPRGTKTDFDKFSRKRLRELTGTLPDDTTYQMWLKSQSRAFQEDVLGVTKAKLFREGKLTLDKFVAQNGSELSLSQLAQKHAESFRAAGLDPKAFI